ncbi:transporter substrate-binding domain-containing protein [Leekyejoonella antrihumi]|uniref:Transporter substrate-binding domain-containing protein n=1 Tax=Leekyejoonella antrihumi TaxID=1660198 RepID=A0A563E9U1_9MICO|nr:transporter substrate-binding domain-containing protein [Leekyejoonella antrihumi]TWP39022.1 transporter substrate-binding domain-containing protein [Leekyejoonella antrihumi]
MTLRSRRATTLAAVLTVGALSLAGCGSSSTGSSGSSGGASGGGGGGTLAKLQKAGTITVGINGENPYSYMDKSGKLTGATIALDRAVYKQLGIKTVTGKQVDWNSLIPGLTAGQFDEVSAGMSALPKRCAQAAFSYPEIVYKTALLVPKGNPKHLHTMADIKKSGANLVTETGAIEQGYAQDMGIQTQTVGTPEAGLQAVESGRADVFALTAISLRTLVKTQNAGSKVEVTPAFTAVVKGKEQIGAGAAVFRKGDTKLLNAYNKELKKIIDNPKEFLKIVGKFGFTEAERPQGKTADTAYLCSGKLPDAK